MFHVKPVGYGGGMFASLFEQSADHADLCFALAALALWVVGVIYLFIQPSPRAKVAILVGIAIVAVGFIPAGLLFLTP